MATPSEMIGDIMTEGEYMMHVLRIFAEADNHGGLTWHMRDGKIRFAALCSDTFAWGTADAEPINPGDILELQVCFHDLAQHGTLALCELPELYAARKRGTRPMNRYMKDVTRTHVPAVTALYEACGPERESTFLAP